MHRDVRDNDLLLFKRVSAKYWFLIIFLLYSIYLIIYIDLYNNTYLNMLYLFSCGLKWWFLIMGFSFLEKVSNYSNNRKLNWKIDLIREFLAIVMRESNENCDYRSIRGWIRIDLSASGMWLTRVSRQGLRGSLVETDGFGTWIRRCIYINIIWTIYSPKVACQIKISKLFQGGHTTFIKTEYYSLVNITNNFELAR